MTPRIPNVPSHILTALEAHREEAPTEHDNLPTDLYRVPEAARLTGISESTIRRLFRAGRLTLYGRPGYYHVSLRDLLPANRREAARLAESPRAARNGVREAPRQRAGERSSPQKA
ncbi:MAG: helix-turn-helix domain-containing protein [Acidobacteriota bacterium]